MAGPSSSIPLKRILLPEAGDTNSEYEYSEQSSPRFRRRLNEPDPPGDWMFDSQGSNMSPLFTSRDLAYGENLLSHGLEGMFTVGDLSDWNSSMNYVSDSQPLADQTPSLSVTPAPPGEISQGVIDSILPDFRSTPENQICYGMIVGEKVKLVGDGENLERRLNTLNRSRQSSRPETLRIARKTDQQLFLVFPDGHDLGYLAEKWTNVFKYLFDKPRVELDAVVDTVRLQKFLHEAKKACDAAVKVHVNVYGPVSERDRIGQELSDKGFFLQTPDHPRPGVEYDNPHLLRLEFGDSTDDSDADPSQGSTTIAEDIAPPQDQELEETIAEVFGGLRRREGLHRVEASEQLHETLFAHQEEALDFMTQRETGEIEPEYRLWQEKEIGGQKWYCHSVTNARHREQQDESGGGILADEMGMGKSLTTLALVAKTLVYGREWAEGQEALDRELSGQRRTHATLVVVPSLVLINTWLREIEKFLGGSVKATKYHGPRRKTILEDLEQFDVVVTTYSTLSKEYSSRSGAINRSRLHKFSWYRVVLDEAHVIRHPATTFHRAAVDLNAKLRWCLSGTPIQNSLLDLGALLAFVQVKPFQHAAAFRHFIANPFKERAMRKAAIDRLKSLLEALCLRRTIDLVNVPGKAEKLRLVEFSKEERQQYDKTQAAMSRMIEQQAAERSYRNNMIGMFQVFLQLRILCNLGTYRHSFAWTKRNLLDEEEDAVCSITRTSLTHCSGCRQPLPVVNRDKAPRYIEHCMHVLCDKCKEDEPYDGDHCPLCKALGAPPFPLRPANKASDHHIRPRHLRDNHHSGDAYFQSEGFSSKMACLITDVQENVGTTKSIIFSCWRRTLDLIAKHLKQTSIKFSRIDSRTPAAERQKILDKFDGSQEIPVLIMTTGTGAFGLNLPSVNRVFIVEPQWNPSVERQAVARAIRLNQRQQVLVIRYQVKNSIEANMFAQQKEKLRIGRMDPKELLGPLPAVNQG